MAQQLWPYTNGLHSNTCGDPGKVLWEFEALEYTVVQLLAFSVSISAINRRGFSCNTLQLGVNCREYLV